MPTPKYNLPLYGDDDTAALDVLLNGQSNAIEAALVRSLWMLGGTEAERDGQPTALVRNSVLYVASDTGKIYQRRANAWVIIWAPATAPGSVSTTAGSGFTLSANTLFTRDGFLLGSIAWSRTAGTLAHADQILRLPTGARPTFSVNTGGLTTPSPAQAQEYTVSPDGWVSVLLPPAGRTAGEIRFTVPVGL